MATSMHVKTKGKWKPVKIDYNLLSQNDFDSLISIEELTDYELIKDYTSGNPGKSKKKQKPEEKENGSKKQNEAKAVKKEKKKKGKKEVSLTNEKNLKGNSKELHVELDTKKKKKGELKKNKKGKLVQMDSQIVDVNQQIEEEDKIENSNKQGKKKKGQKRKKTTEDNSPSKKLKQNIPDMAAEDTGTDNTVSEETNPENTDSAIPVNNKKDVMKEMVQWKDLYVPEEVLLALLDSKFITPTHIQSLTLPHAIRDRLDIVGAAETGSGKTLAFGIPVIHKILKYKKEKLNKELQTDCEEEDNETEEIIKNESLEEGVEGDESNEDYHSDSEDELEWESDEENEDSNSDESLTDENEDSEFEDEEMQESSDGQQEMGCVTVVDDADFSSLGITEIKPSTNDHPFALILEPTRELAVQVRNHLLAVLKYTDIQVATLVGGMSLQKQQRVLKRRPEILVATPGRLWELFQMGDPYLVNIDQIHSLVIDEADRMVEKGHFEELEKLCQHINKDEQKRKKRQNFVYSATLTMIHVGSYRPTKKKRVKMTETEKLESLMERIGLRHKPKVIDLSRKTGTVETLTEARINCTKEEKDLFLYYFLQQFPGRTLVFANSKDCIRRLVSIFTLLQTKPLPLHADMHQKQRLKNLEKFTADPNSLLLASDVAARGLDIPNVQHVFHYQVPLTVENYVHRSGRTARASKEGISVMLIGPDDVKNYRKIIHTLNRNEDLPMIPVDYQMLPSLKQRLSLALKIDVTDYRFEKKKRQNNWFIKAANEMDIELDDRHLLNDIGDSHEQSQHKHHMKQLKQELNSLLHSTLTSKTFSGKYPTKTGKLMMPEESKKGSDAISSVKKDKKSQEKLIQQIQKERILMSKALDNKKKEKQSKRQQKKNKRKNKES
ncbi:ATP-dependent RNA helicase DDX24/MAK5 [Mytilus galloprovincialis]|uniref:RNA helicase n=1 Tax=Mytilus galloprovincialis TaxID=29158 RepID=A0A8B6HCT4_MYTGA|nr:ATP-dependent RNA helicase DDX24/MAK5 [Mytilus galloprovincialis]